MTDMDRYVTVHDFRAVAKENLPGDFFDYIDGGAGDEWTLAENRRSFERWTFRPRFLRGAGRPDTSTTLLGRPLRFPLLIAPWAFQYMAHPEGEQHTARAAAKAGTIMVVSSTTDAFLEDVAAASDGPKWWQCYVYEDHGVTAAILDRVSAAGFDALCVTVDFPVGGFRDRDARSGLELPVPVAGPDIMYDPLLSWDDLGWMRERTPGMPLILKGILTAEDALLALDAGADAVVVSNHGGRQLDGAPAGLTALPEVVDAVAGKIPVLMDGGIRRGTDMLKAMALGANAVLTARPFAMALAAEGEAGVTHALEILREEFENAMALTGCRTVAEITKDLISPAPR
ncbi:MAG: (S)-2-hydroxy-acid oxidase [Actinomycetota bacterium]|nr:(S)-2-hydroxy-acid oxidase [Actinomycetota bacterium]